MSISRVMFARGETVIVSFFASKSTPLTPVPFIVSTAKKRKNQKKKDEQVKQKISAIMIFKYFLHSQTGVSLPRDSLSWRRHLWPTLNVNLPAEPQKYISIPIFSHYPHISTPFWIEKHLILTNLVGSYNHDNLAQKTYFS